MSGATVRVGVDEDHSSASVHLRAGVASVAAHASDAEETSLFSRPRAPVRGCPPHYQPIGSERSKHWECRQMNKRPQHLSLRLEGGARRAPRALSSLVALRATPRSGAVLPVAALSAAGLLTASSLALP